MGLRSKSRTMASIANLRGHARQTNKMEHWKYTIHLNLNQHHNFNQTTTK